MTAATVELIPALSDNYIYLLRDPGSDAVAIVDPGEAAPAIAALERHRLRLTHILNTHHHGDHIAGNGELVRRWGAKLIAPAANRDQIPDIDQAVSDGDTVSVGTLRFDVLAVPGHTLGHVAFWSAEPAVLFAGDTLFALGCGRMFEGTAEQMWGSLQRLAALPPETLVYCGHEYTQSNARFALAVDPGNTALQQRAAEIDALRAEGRPTVPSTIGTERRTNPFLRAGDAAAFATLRKQKDQFR
jgi:hydroxyacylglutathione hydrolase